jgi:hypothetical protein
MAARAHCSRHIRERGPLFVTPGPEKLRAIIVNRAAGVVGYTSGGLRDGEVLLGQAIGFAHEENVAPRWENRESVQAAYILLDWNILGSCRGM